MSERVLIVPVRAVTGLVAVLLLLIVAAVVWAQPAAREAVSRVVDPRTTADPARLDQQRTAAEHATQRGYLKAAGQLAEVRKLTLAIPAAQAAAIDERARADLRAIRHDALVALGTRLGLASAALEAYVTAVEGQLGDSALPDERPVLLAPGLHAIVARADDLFQRSADAATAELTRAPSASPTRRP